MISILAIISSVALVICIGVIVSLRRRMHASRDAQRAWTDTVHNLSVELNRLSTSNARAEQWPRHLCDLLNACFHADGAVIYRRGDAPDSTPDIRIVGHAGSWRLMPTDPEPVLSLSAGIPNDFFWSRRPLVYSGDAVRAWLPDSLSADIHSALVAPITVSKQLEYFALLYRGPGQDEYALGDQQLMAECIGQIELALRVIFSIRERKLAETALARAHEEGMLQISTGIIHNIGNAITVIQLALDRLHSEDLQNVSGLVELLDTEMLPTLQARQADGTLQAFLSDDPQGREYLGALQDMVLQIRKVLAQQSEDTDFITEKFRNVTEIISLQQQFIGELGTENVVSVRGLLEDVVKMAHGPLDQREIKLNTDFMARGRVLVDPAMVRHIILMLLKYSIESVTASRKVAPAITIAALESKADERAWVRITVTDNGAGISIDLDNLESRLEEAPTDERARDLLFCRRRIEKYGGSLLMSSDMARGLRFAVEIPEYVPEDGVVPPSAPVVDTMTAALEETQAEPAISLADKLGTAPGADTTFLTRDDLPSIDKDETVNASLEETRDAPPPPDR